ncbi:phosphotriesterase family protein [Bauldia sp.]|uniref:phosphotriesterase family protein n=1 Tax=Bauldia sp. TaxID=2575872 RepID=UPI003BAB5B67
MTTYAQTVNGPVPAETLGAVLMHEHILCDLRAPATRASNSGAPITIENRFAVDYFQNRNPRNTVLDEDAIAIRELERFGASGGGAIVELTVGGLDPQPQRLAAIAEAVGVAVIIGAGYYVADYMPAEIREADVDTLADVMRTALDIGAHGTDVRAGIIGELGCSWPLADVERRQLTAAAIVQAETGAAITVHPGRHPDAPLEIADILVAAGADPSRCVIGHMDRTIFDRPRLLTLLNRGFVLEWDFFGIETSQYWMADEDLDLPTDYMRLDLIRDLMATGFRDQITVSHDICTRTRLASYGGHGYTHLLDHIVPMMRRRGWRDADVHRLLVETPARLLCYLGAPPNTSETR